MYRLFNGDTVGGVKIGVNDIYTTINDGFAFEIAFYDSNNYMNDTSVKIVSTLDTYENDTFLYRIGWSGNYEQVSRFGAKDWLGGVINDVAYSIQSEAVESSTAIKCSDDEISSEWSDDSIVDTSKIYDSITYWQQNADELAAWTVDEMEDELRGIYKSDPMPTTDGGEISIRELAKLYTDAAHRLARELKSDIESSDDIKCAEEFTSLRDRDITSADDVTELVLYITNDADLYHQRAVPMIENLKKKVKKGTYDRELAVKLWQYLADDGVRKYDKEFGSKRGSLTLLNKATRQEIARQLRDYYEEQIMWDFNHANDGNDDLTTL